MRNLTPLSGNGGEMDELIQALDDALDELGEASKRCDDIGIRHASEAVARAKMLAEPEWGEPKAEGWHWIEGINLPCYVYRTEPEDVADNDTWSFSGFDVDGDGYDYRGLNGRRVAPCVGRLRKAGE